MRITKEQTLARMAQIVESIEEIELTEARAFRVTNPVVLVVYETLFIMLGLKGDKNFKDLGRETRRDTLRLLLCDFDPDRISKETMT